MTAERTPRFPRWIGRRGMREAYPEKDAGGFGRNDGTIAFYTRVNALVRRSDVVLDLGAGRGEWLEDAVPYRRDLRLLQGKVAEVIGADVDPIVSSNPSCDRTIVMESPIEIPLPDQSVDFIVSDYTIEHVADPVPWVSEIERILRPGGWLAGRTPNRWGYIGVATNLVPNSAHTRVLSRVQPQRKEVDVFPTTYRLNTRRALNRAFAPPVWTNVSYTHNAEPAYFGSSPRIIRNVDRVLSRVPAGLGATWFVFVRKAT